MTHLNRFFIKILLNSFIIFEFAILILSINFISSSVLLGNLSHSFDEVYAQNSFLKGWINLSFINESSSTLIQSINKSLTLDDLFKKNDIDCRINEKCSCYPSDCSTKYVSIGEDRASISYDLETLKSKLIGIKITGNITQINNFKFNISTNAQESCISPLVIDLLDDKYYEFEESGISDNSCGSQITYGCFNTSSAFETTPVSTNPLCGIISLTPSKGYAVGAKLNGNGNAKFHVTLEVDNFQGSCNLVLSETGEKSCNIIIDEPLTENNNATICINADRQNTNLYSIKFEDNNPCGYVDENDIRYQHDFELFAKPLMYKAPGKFSFDQKLFDDIELSSIILDYIDNKYNNNCDPECIIPVRFYSGSNQIINISELILSYRSQGLDKPAITEFSEINKSSYILNSKFLNLDIEKLEFKVPSALGIKNLTMKIGDKTINYSIHIENLPLISELLPNQTTLLVPTLFGIIIDNYGNETYSFSWDFGDGIKLQSDKPYVEHTYSELGVYRLTVNVSNKFGTSSRKFTVEVLNPYDAINITLNKYNKRIINLENNISLFPTWIQGEAKKISKIDDLKSEIKRLDGKYKETFRDEVLELDKIMKELSVLNVPIGISNPLYLNNVLFFLNKENFKPEIFEKLGAGSVEAEKDYYEYIQYWLNENVDITFSSNTYSIYNDDNEQSFSHVTLTLIPKKDIEKLFIFIEGNSNIKFKEYYDDKEIDNGYGLIIKSLVTGTTKSIEFIYPESINIENNLIFISPLFDELDFLPEPGICDSDKVCEKSKGENYKNCRNDCKPWKLTFLFLIILLIVTFVIYVSLQEWYKRYYESYLFKDKNQLFNLITFMSICISGIKLEKNEIYGKLKQSGWKGEQIEYAWRKLHGMRTGMWEIPIFKIFERKKVAEEIEKRKVFFGNTPRSFNPEKRL